MIDEDEEEFSESLFASPRKRRQCTQINPRHVDPTSSGMCSTLSDTAPLTSQLSSTHRRTVKKKPVGPKRVFMVTLSRADLTVFPSRESFGKAVADEMSTGGECDSLNVGLLP